MIGRQPSYYVVNTNYTNNRQAHEDMLNNHKAAAYYSPWKHKIADIQKGDRVFLYQSTVGIIAVGTGTGVVQTETYEGSPEEEYYMVLDDFILLQKPMTATEMKKAANSYLAFVQTIFSLPQEKADFIWQYIKKHCM